MPWDHRPRYEARTCLTLTVTANGPRYSSASATPSNRTAAMRALTECHEILRTEETDDGRSLLRSQADA